MCRILPVAILAFIGLLTACSSAEPASVASTKEPVPTSEATPVQTPRPTGVSYSIEGQPFGVGPTVSPTPIPIHHPPPYTVAIEAGHGGPSWWGSSAYHDGQRYIEKDLNLDMALRLNALLLDRGFNTILLRDGDYTLLPFDGASYRPSFTTETQARVDLANEAQADIIISLHFNGSTVSSIGGTETYYNPDRSFGNESHNLASFVHDAVLRALGEIEGYSVRDRGVRNDAEVGGDPANAHSYLLGTNRRFRPSLMPGIIAEPLFMSDSENLAVIVHDAHRQRLAEAMAEGIAAYFEWLWPVG
ncbi:MAG TPA: N-acetylmuramoyl-L-alanine amidase [Dehalococcoidia bacterium]|nr:N-acetylmuramoyl-L-alanine amidase [Dehalococcoidia bacterium]